MKVLSGCILLFVAIVGLAGVSASDGFGSRPHIVVLLCDNVGWANVGYHRPPKEDPRETQTKHIDALARSGLELDRHYTYKFCSPSRSSFLSGRLPFHVNIYNDDPAMQGAGVPTNMTIIASKLRQVGYQPHMIGKWHVGMARPANTPLGKGFASSLNYFHSENNYYNQQRFQGCGDRPAVDLWDTDRPASQLNGTAYEEQLFSDRAVSVIENHDPDTPLFLYYALHTSCVGQKGGGFSGGLQPQQEYYERFAFIDDPDRRANHAMVAFMDEVVGNVTSALEKKGMWGNTLFLWASDNGGAVHIGGGANNYPLRGGYYNNWEGGIRTAALLNGGALPEAVRGMKLEGFIHECDWFATFCHLAGVDPKDPVTTMTTPAGTTVPLPPIDSLNVWPLIIGLNNTSPRVEWPLTPIGEDTYRAPHGGDAAYMAEGRYKLLVGQVHQSGWCGQVHPNLTQPWDSFNSIENCTRPGKIGCLFDVLTDPREQHDLALEMPEKAMEVYQKLQAAQTRWFNPDRGQPDPRACQVANQTGFWGPFLDGY